MSPVIFTPSDEPYLGRELLCAFDNLICACLEVNSKCAILSHNDELTDFQRAACILVPQTITLALSIRELIRQGYLFGAKVLMRPFAERAITTLYLFHSGEGLRLWNEGWDYRKRPSLQKMMECVNEALLEGAYPSMKGFCHDFNSAIHGDPFSAKWNITFHDGVPVFPVSKNLCSPQLVDEICAEAIPWLACTMGMMSAAFSDQQDTDERTN